MNDEISTPEPSVQPDAFLPLALIGASLVIIFLWQISMITEQRAAAQTIIQRQEEQVKQSRQVQANLERLVNDLLDLAQNDSEAQAIVTKYNIARTGPAPAPTTK